MLPPRPLLPLHPHDPPSAGPYRLLARLGEDTHTRSYLGTAPERPPVRVRILRPEHATDPNARADFARRVESAFGLGGPHVAAVTDADLDSPVPWVATERPLGPDLAALVQAHGPLPVAALHPLALATAQGLAALHNGRRAHGTLTPESVLLTGDRALLADPGVTPTGTGEGDASVFSPPEGGGSPAGDVFSWAALLCFAAGGVEGPDGLDRVPLQLRGVVDACLRGNASLRPSAVDLVSMLGGTASAAPWPPELSSVVEDSTTTMREALAAEDSAPEPGGRGRFLALTAGALALTLVVASGAVWGLGRLTRPAGEEPIGGTVAAEDSGLITDAACLDGHGFPEPSEPVTDLDATEVAFSPDGDVLAVSSYNHGLTLWDWREGEEFARPTEEQNDYGPMAFAPAGCMIAATSLQEHEHQEQPYLRATTYDLPSGEAVDQFGAQSGPDTIQEIHSVESLDFSPDGRRLALLHKSTTLMDENPTIGVVDTRTGEVTRTLGISTDNALAFLDESRLAVQGDSSLVVWDVETGEELQTVRNVTDKLFTAVPGRNEVIVMRGNAFVWLDLDDNSEIADFPVPELDDAEQYWFNDLGVDPDRGLVHFGWSMQPEGAGSRYRTDRDVDTFGYLWDAETGENLLEDDDSLMTRPVAFHPEVIAAVNQDGDVDLIDPDTLEVIDVIG